MADEVLADDYDGARADCMPAEQEARVRCPVVNVGVRKEMVVTTQKQRTNTCKRSRQKIKDMNLPKISSSVSKVKISLKHFLELFCRI